METFQRDYKVDDNIPNMMLLTHHSPIDITMNLPVFYDILGLNMQMRLSDQIRANLHQEKSGPRQDFAVFPHSPQSQI